jgi:hypothetical protein
VVTVVTLVVALVVAVVAVVVTGMISVSDAVDVSPPAVPATARIVLPVGAVFETVKLSTELVLPPAGGVTGLLLKPPVMPSGSVGTERVTGELKLPIDRTVIVTVPIPPRLIVIVLGFVEMEKEGCAPEVTTNVAEADVPALPRTKIV